MTSPASSKISWTLRRTRPPAVYSRELISRFTLPSAPKVRELVRGIAPPINLELLHGDTAELATRASHDLGRIVAAETDGVLKIPLFFGTNRKPSAKNEPGFEGELVNDVSFGLAYVTIPLTSHRHGKIEAPLLVDTLQRIRCRTSLYSINARPDIPAIRIQLEARDRSHRREGARGTRLRSRLQRHLRGSRPARCPDLVRHELSGSHPALQLALARILVAFAIGGLPLLSRRSPRRSLWQETR